MLIGCWNSVLKQRCWSRKGGRSAEGVRKECGETSVTLGANRFLLLRRIINCILAGLLTFYHCTGLYDLCPGEGYSKAAPLLMMTRPCKTVQLRSLAESHAAARTDSPFRALSSSGTLPDCYTRRRRTGDSANPAWKAQIHQRFQRPRRQPRQQTDQDAQEQRSRPARAHQARQGPLRRRTTRRCVHYQFTKVMRNARAVFYASPQL